MPSSTKTDAPPQPNRRGPGRPTLSDGELLDKALDLFLRDGFERTSIDGITASAGMAKRTVYARYGSKENLFRAALLRAIEDWIVPIQVLRDAEVEDVEQTLLNISRILVGNLMTPAGLRLLRITNAESGRRPEIGAYTFEHGAQPTVEYLSDLLRRRIGPADAPKAHWEQAAIAFMYLIFTGPPTLTAWGVPIDEAMIDAQTVFGVRLYLHGLLAQTPRAGG